jgi:hypothetical protein
MNKKFRNAGLFITSFVRRTPGENIADLGGVGTAVTFSRHHQFSALRMVGPDKVWRGNPRRFWSHRPQAAPQLVNCVSGQQPHFET